MKWAPKTIPTTTNSFEGNLALHMAEAKDTAEARPDVDTGAGQTTPPRRTTPHVTKTEDTVKTVLDINTAAGQTMLTPQTGNGNCELHIEQTGQTPALQLGRKFSLMVVRGLKTFWFIPHEQGTRGSDR